MTDVPIPMSAGPDTPATDDGYAVAMDAAMNAHTAYARAKAVDQLEQIALARTADLDQQAAQEEVAFPAPVTSLAYQFVTPPGLEPMGEVETGEVRAALFSEGIPAEFVAQGSSNLAQLRLSGALATEESYAEACGRCRSDVEKMLGADAPGMIRDGIAFIEALAKKHTALDEAATAALADPFLLINAANLQRQRSRRS